MRLKGIRAAALLFLALSFCAHIAHAQGGNIGNAAGGFVVSSSGRPAAGVNVSVCTSNATIGTSTTPCSSLATIYFDAALTMTQNQSPPLTTDGLGNYPTMWGPPGVYQVQIWGPTIAVRMFPVSVGCVPGAGACGTTLASILANNNAWTGSNNFTGTVLGNAAAKPATSDGVQFVSLSGNGNDSNDGLFWGTAKATIGAALTALPTCTPAPSSNGGLATNSFSGKCGRIYLGNDGSSSSSGYSISSSVIINSTMVRIIGTDKLSTQIQCTTSPCIEFSGANAGGGFTNSPNPVMSASGGLENITLLGNGSANQVGVLNLDATGISHKDVRIANFNGTGAVCMEFQNDANGITERVRMDNVALDNCTTAMLHTASSSSLLSFDHQDYSHLQITLDNAQTAWALSGFAQWTGFVDGVVNTNSPNTNTYTGLSISNSAAVSAVWNLVFDNAGGGTLTQFSGTSASNLHIWGVDPANSWSFLTRDRPFIINVTTPNAFNGNCYALSGTEKWCIYLDPSNFLGFFNTTTSTEDFTVLHGGVVVAGSTSGSQTWNPGANPTGTVNFPPNPVTGTTLGNGFRTSVAGSTTLLAANSCGDTVTVTVTGATTSMDAHASGAVSAGLIPYAWVSGANTVSVEYCNVTAAGITPGAATLQVSVTQ